MDIPPKILKRIKKHFPGKKPSEIFEILSLYGEEDYEYEVERVQCAILKLSNGNFEDLLHYIEAAKKDYRDVLYWVNDGV